jgi:oligopeptidase B
MQSQTQAPPTAPRIEHRETRHGATVIDPYFWLREKSSPQVVKYLEAENAYTEAMTGNLKPFSDAIYQRCWGNYRQISQSRPAGAILLLLTHRGRQAIPIQCRRRTLWKPGEFPDLNDLGRTAFVGLGSFTWS